MSLWSLPLFHLIAALLLVLPPLHRAGAWLNLAVGAGGLAITLFLLLSGTEPAAGSWLRLDGLNRPLLAAAAFTGFTTAWFSLGWLPGEANTSRLPQRAARLYHPVFQFILCGLHTALLADHLGLLWAGLEAATLASLLLIALTGQTAALEAAWRAFLQCSAGIALALFGTLLFHIAAQSIGLQPEFALSYVSLATRAPDLPTGLTGLGFLLILSGYGVKAGLVPLHQWLADAHAEGPVPVAAVLSGLSLSVALYAILRFAVLAIPAGELPHLLLAGAGLITALIAGPLLFRRSNPIQPPDPRRFFAFSSIEMTGLACLAFGLGGTLGTQAGVGLILTQMLTKPALFFLLGRLQQHPPLPPDPKAPLPLAGWLFAGLILCLIGLPPFIGFGPKLGLAGAAFGAHALIGLALMLALCLSGWAILRFSWHLWLDKNAPRPAVPVTLRASLYAPVALHLLLVLAGGLLSFDPLVQALRAAAEVMR
jgi:hydrogenase-4 component F